MCDLCRVFCYSLHVVEHAHACGVCSQVVCWRTCTLVWFLWCLCYSLHVVEHANLSGVCAICWRISTRVWCIWCLCCLWCLWCLCRKLPWCSCDQHPCDFTLRIFIDVNYDYGTTVCIQSLHDFQLLCVCVDWNLIAIFGQQLCLSIFNIKKMFDLDCLSTDINSCLILCNTLCCLVESRAICISEFCNRISTNYECKSQLISSSLSSRYIFCKHVEQVWRDNGIR